MVLKGMLIKVKTESHFLFPRYLYKMMKGKNTVVFLLMASSILLLIILEVFWLRSAYRDAADNFKRQTSSIFRNTIFAMHDSLIEKSIEPVHADSATSSFKRPKIRLNKLSAVDVRDSLIDFYNVEERTTKVEVFLSGEGKPDSVTRIVRRMLPKIPRGDGSHTFIIRLGPDSLKIDSIKKEFKHSLSEAGIDSRFVIYKLKRERLEKEPPRPKGRYTTDLVAFNPINHYAASFIDADRILLKEITPQILFAVFLTLLTAVSFYMMYKNLRSQQLLMEAKNDFISNVTHELKTPVATVSVTLEALQNFNVLNNPQLSQEYLEIAQRELKRLNEITDKILKTSVLENKIVITPETTDLDVLVKRVLNDMALLFEKRNATVNCESEGSDFQINCNGHQLYQMVENLLDNALKYSPENPQIKIHLKGLQDYILFSVSDNGIGIEKAYQHKIFEKFFRVPTGDVHNIKGYGLGLSYVFNLVKALGGEISIDSEPGKGSTFLIKFQRTKVLKY